jgi:hypothetical protein
MDADSWLRSPPGILPDHHRHLRSRDNTDVSAGLPDQLCQLLLGNAPEMLPRGLLRLTNF